MSYLKYTLALLISLCVAACSFAQDASERFDEIASIHESQDNVGLAISLRQSGKPSENQYIGSAVLEYNLPVNAQTRFQVMSVTKAFVGAVLIKAETAGLVDLDVPVQTYLPDYPKPESGDITLRRLAAHTAGIPHLSHPTRKAVYVNHYDSAEQSLEMFAELPLLHMPGESYAYSSAGYTLIAAVLEQVYDKPFPEILQAVIAEPLGLSATASGNVMRSEPNVARNYSYVDIWTYQPSEELQLVPTWDFSYNFGGGNLVTTASDLSKFGKAFLKPGFFSEAELESIYTQIDPESSRWGFGWFVNETEAGETYLSISGATPGVQAGLLVYPDRDAIISIISNAWGKNSAGGDLVVGAPKRVMDALGNE